VEVPPSAPPVVAPPAPEPPASIPTPAPPSGAVASAPPAPVRGSLLIRSVPADADVQVNGRAAGKTPLTVRDLTLGSYTIRVVRDGYAAEERTLRLTTQQPTQSTTLTLRTVSTVSSLTVLSRPVGARVFINNRLVGSTPLAIPGLPAGPATVRIEMDGYRTWTTTAQLGPGGQTRVAASLERE